MWRIGLLVVVSMSAAAVPLRAGAAAERAVRVLVRDAGENRSLEGELIVEADDGGLLLQLPDQRLEIVDPTAIVATEPVARAARWEEPRDLGARILGELPPGFDQVATKHYVLCFDTSRAYAQWCGALFERLHDAFQNFWRQAGFDPEEPRQPLIVVIFSDRERYESFAARDLGAAADRVVGYYNLMSNRVTTFDLTGSDTLARRPARSAGTAGLEILASPEASGLVATLVHEATHQMAFNCGMHRRLAAVPVWVSEGVATYFETPDLGNGRGWRGIGGINRPRLKKFLAAHRPGMLEPMVLGDEPFRRADEAIEAYARAWALAYFLLQTRRESFIDYLRTLSRKEPFGEDSPEIRRQDFIDAFGEPPSAFEEPLLKFTARLPVRGQSPP